MILSIYEKKKLDRLKEKDIVIEEIYINPNYENKKFVRASDGKMRDKILDNILSEKRYFYNNEYVTKETEFNKKIRHTIVDYNDKNEIVTCPNCGYKGKVIDLIDGCPYCYTNFNYGINNEKVMKKHKIDKTKISPIFKYVNILILLKAIIKTIVDIIVGNYFTYVPIMLLINLVIIYPIAIILSIIIILIHSTINMKKIEQKYLQEEQEFLKINNYENIVSKNLYTELISYLYDTEKDLIDFDILELDYIEKNENLANVIIHLRKTYFISGKIDSKKSFYKITMIKNSKYKNISDKDVIECSSCGASIDVTMKECEYCNKINNIKNEWILEKIEQYIPNIPEENKNE